MSVRAFLLKEAEQTVLLSSSECGSGPGVWRRQRLHRWSGTAFVRVLVQQRWWWPPSGSSLPDALAPCVKRVRYSLCGHGLHQPWSP